MNDLKEKYERFANERKDIINELNELKDNDKVKKYLELSEKRGKLFYELQELKIQIKINEYSNCSHIWVTSKYDYDYMEGRGYRYYGCIKCGLDESSLYLASTYHDINFLTPDKRLMYNYLKGKGHTGLGGIVSKCSCNLDLGMQIYRKIYDSMPDISDEVALKFFEILLKDTEKNEKDENIINNEEKIRVKK